MPPTTPEGAYRIVVHVRSNPTSALEAQAAVNYTLTP
jgi:hypothetical protein